MIFAGCDNIDNETKLNSIGMDIHNSCMEILMREFFEMFMA